MVDLRFRVLLSTIGGITIFLALSFSGFFKVVVEFVESSTVRILVKPLPQSPTSLGEKGGQAARARASIVHYGWFMWAES